MFASISTLTILRNSRVDILCDVHVNACVRVYSEVNSVRENMLEICWIWAKERIRFRKSARIRLRPWKMRSILRNFLRERYRTRREGRDLVQAMSHCRLIFWSMVENCEAPWHWAKKSFPDVWISQQMTIIWLLDAWNRPIHGNLVRINIFILHLIFTFIRSFYIAGSFKGLRSVIVLINKY